ncbi:MAG: hypothetical protein M3Y82_00590, partial [Verrucomicrobiota bacterium]|nr:hypothetical protein [Verrucomicrobiota bacterium]
LVLTTVAAEKPASVNLPPQPWHLADIWWNFQSATTNFESLEVEVTIDRDVPSTYNLYISPCGIARINGLDFYGGLQSNINGWANATNQTRVHPGKGAIFSRWSNDKKTPVGLENVRVAGSDCLIESAGYEGEFASVRRPFPWTKGTYTYQISKGQTKIAEGKTNTWFICRVKDSAGQVKEIGSLLFEGESFTFWEKHSAFVEVYSTAKIPHSEIPEVKITFGYPRVNGQYPKLKSALVIHPAAGERSGAPDAATVVADGSTVVVNLGPIFQRLVKDRKHSLELSAPPNG